MLSSAYRRILTTDFVITKQSLAGEGGGEGKMKKRVSLLIEEEVIRHAKQCAAEEGRPLGDLIQDVLVSYLSNKAPFQRTRDDAYQLFCERPMRISKKHFNEILAEHA